MSRLGSPCRSLFVCCHAPGGFVPALPAHLEFLVVALDRCGTAAALAAETDGRFFLHGRRFGGGFAGGPLRRLRRVEGARQRTLRPLLLFHCVNQTIFENLGRCLVLIIDDG